MAQSFEDECFSDGDLDLLASHTINELENQVLQSTQQKKKAEAQSTLAQELQLRGRLNQVNSARECYAKDVGPKGSSDYGLDDEDIIDLDLNQYAFSDQPQALKPELPSGRVQDRDTRSNTPGQEQQLRDALQARQPVSLASRPAQHGGTSTIQSNDLPSYNAQGGADGIEIAENAPVQAMSDVSNRGELYFRIQKLEQELAIAQKSVEEAKSKATAKAGETAIVRSNHEKSIKEYEQRLASVQMSHAHETARQKAELEASKKNREKIETSNLFLQHELNQEAQKSKHTRKTNRETVYSPTMEAGQNSPAITPRKNRSVLFGDGFDTGEEMLISPSKSKGKSKASTPKHNGKRKRNVAGASPAQALPLQETQVGASTPKNVDAGREEPDAALTTSFRPEDEKYQFVQLLLAHAPRAGHVETIEAFAKHSFPSDPRKTLSSIFYEELLLLTDAKDVAELSLGICNIMFTLWSRCQEDKYYDPLYLIVEALHYIIRTQAMRVSVAIVDKLLPLAFSTIDLIAIPVVTSITSKSVPKPPVATDHRLKEKIDVYKILALVQRVALCCAQSSDGDGDAKVKFWKKAEYDFVLLMLNIAQPLEQIDLMLQILCTSSLPESIGAALDQPDPARQARKEAVLLDLITYLLIEKPISSGTPETSTLSKPSPLPSFSSRHLQDAPNPSPPSPPYCRTQIAELRYSVITVLATFIHHPHGGRALATHRTTLGRLVSFIHDAFKSLYSLNPMIPAHLLPSSSSSSLLTSSSSSSSSTSPVRAATIASINMAVRVLYHVFTQYADLVNVREKLAAVPGAAQKHLVALGRIAFCEGVASEQENSDEQQREDRGNRANGNDDTMDVETTTGNEGDGNTDADEKSPPPPNIRDTTTDGNNDNTKTSSSSCLSVMEEGIEEEVIEAAHMMLEDFLTPEEGEALVAAFVPDVAGKGRAGRDNTNDDDDDDDDTDDTDDTTDDTDAAEDSDTNEESEIERAERLGHCRES